MIREAKLDEFPGYTFYSDGKIKSQRNNRNFFISPWPNKDGYQCVNLYTKDNKRKTTFVHRAIAAAFLGPNYLEVNHVDGIRDNNKLENLEYCSRDKNQADRFKNKKRFVTFVKKVNKYQAQVWVGDNLNYLGAFEDKEEAYDVAYEFYLETFGKEPWSKNV